MTGPIRIKSGRQVTGFTHVVYEPGPTPEQWSKLRALGVVNARTISDTQSTYWMPDESGTPRFWSHQYVDAARDAPVAELWQSWNELALPLHGPSWTDTSQAFDPQIFVPWAAALIKHMTRPGRPLHICWGNEPDADQSPYLNDEAAFRERYALLCKAVALSGCNIKLGAGGWCLDWNRAAAFIAYCKTAGMRLDFVDIHLYGDPTRARTAIETIRAVSDVQIAVLESGVDWRTGATPPESEQRAWFAAMSSALDAPGVGPWHIHYGAGAADVHALSILDRDTGDPTIIGQCIESAFERGNEMTEAEEEEIAEREALFAAWRTGAFLEDILKRADSIGAELKVLATAQRVAAQSVADDAKQMREAAEKAPAAQRASDIARDAVALFADRYTVSTKGDAANRAMQECVTLAAFARKQAEAP